MEKVDAAWWSNVIESLSGLRETMIESEGRIREVDQSYQSSVISPLTLLIEAMVGLQTHWTPTHLLFGNGTVWSCAYPKKINVDDTIIPGWDILKIDFGWFADIIPNFSKNTELPRGLHSYVAQIHCPETPKHSALLVVRRIFNQPEKIGSTALYALCFGCTNIHLLQETRNDAPEVIRRE